MHCNGWSVLFIILESLLRFSEEACYDYIEEKQKILSPGYSRKYFGTSVVLGNGFLVVGSKSDSANGLNSGAAHVYNNVDGEWMYNSKLVPSQGGAYAECGTSLAVDGKVLLVGCPRDGVNGIDSGSIYLFELDNGTWVEKQKLVPSDGKPNALFGKYLDVSKDTVVVNSNTDSVGLAYVFELNSTTWVEVGKLESSVGRSVQHGHSVAIHDNSVVVGHWYDDANGHQSGSASIFQKFDGKWILDGIVRPSNGSHADWFGISVAISDRYVVISSHGDDVNGADGSGSAYVFHNVQGEWKETAKLLPRNGTSGDSFGYPISISKNTIIIGCTGYDSQDTYNSGAVHLFQNNNDTNWAWAESYKLLASDGEYNDMFGYSISLHQQTIAVAGVNHEDRTGRVYIFDNLNAAGDPSVLCDPPPPTAKEEVDFALILGVSVPLCLVLIVLVVVCARKVCGKFTVVKTEEDGYVYYQFVYKDTPPTDEEKSVP